jgi:excisionase family DNA binding protein
MKRTLNAEVLAAATVLLQSADPDLTPTTLLEALQNRQTAPKKPPGKMLTLREFCDLTKISMPTVLRMIKRGDLQTVVIGQRNRRIPADVAGHFLNADA